MPISTVVAVALQLASPAAGSAPARASPSTTVDDAKRKCRSTEVTGSLVPAKRICRTVGEWRRLDEEARETAQRIIDRGTINSCAERCPG